MSLLEETIWKVQILWWESALLWGKPSNRVSASTKRAIPRNKFGQCRSGFDSRPSTKCGFIREKAARFIILRLFYVIIYRYLGENNVFNKGFNAIFMTRPFWNEMNVPQSLVLKIYKEYLGSENKIITSRAESIEYILPIVDRLQSEILDWIKSTNTNQVIKDLYQIFDKCFGLYITEKGARKQLVELNISDDDILEAFNCNRNMAVNVINSVNIWLENAVLYQNEADPTQVDEGSAADCELFVKLYLYGLTSKTLSLLSLSRKFEEKDLFYGINLSLESNEPIDVIRYHPIIYYNPALTGNQDAFKLTVDDYKQADHSLFGIGFQKEHGLSFLLSMRVISTFQKFLLKDGKYAHVVISKSHFLKLVTQYSSGQVDAQRFFDAFALTQSNVASHLRKSDKLIWLMGTNKYRHEIRPFICLENDNVAISYRAMDQAKNIWLSYFANGGMIYTTEKDQLTASIEERNSELSQLLVKMLRDTLRNQYHADFDRIDVKYDAIFGRQSIDYGDYDIVFYTKDTNELFLIEAKFFSDSLNNSGAINDHQKLFEKNGYYDHCRSRCDLVIREKQAMKDFVGATGTIDVHFLFVSSKPLEIEFTDKDGIVSFPCFPIFESYLKGNLISEDGTSVIRPTIQL